MCKMSGILSSHLTRNVVTILRVRVPVHRYCQSGHNGRGSMGSDELDHVGIAGDGMQGSREGIQSWLVEIAQRLRSAQSDSVIHPSNAPQCPFHLAQSRRQCLILPRTPFAAI